MLCAAKLTRAPDFKGRIFLHSLWRWWLQYVTAHWTLEKMKWNVKRENERGKISDIELTHYKWFDCSSKKRWMFGVCNLNSTFKFIGWEKGVRMKLNFLIKTYSPRLSYIFQVKMQFFSPINDSYSSESELNSWRFFKWRHLKATLPFLQHLSSNAFNYGNNETDSSLYGHS